jgi:lysophospholipase L1-like esterase
MGTMVPGGGWAYNYGNGKIEANVEGVVVATVDTTGLTSANLAARGIRICAIGDSLNEHNHFRSSNFGSWARGVLSWVKALDPRFVFETWVDAATSTGFNGDNLGVGSTTAAQIAVTMTAAIARRPDVIYMNGGTNDMSSSTATEAVIASLLTAIDLAVASGIPVVYEAVSARGTSGTGAWAAGSDARKRYSYVNRRMRDELRKRRAAHFFDPNPYWAARVDPAVPITGYNKSGSAATVDPTHRSARGAYAVAVGLLPLLQSLFPARGSWPFANADDVYDATINTKGAVTLNPLLLGTAGTHGTGSSGASGVATGWRSERNSGSSTVVASKSVNDEQVLTYTPGAVAQTELFYLRPSAGADLTHGLAAGTWVKISWLVSLAAWDGWKGVTAYLKDNGTGGITSYGMYFLDPDSDDTGLWPGTALPNLLIETDPIELVSDSLTIRPRLEIRIKGDAAGTGVLTIHQGGVRVVENPKTIRGL